MPVIKVEMAPRSSEVKKEIIERLTTELSEIIELPKEAITVLIDEYDSDNIGVGGVVLTEKTKSK